MPQIHGSRMVVIRRRRRNANPMGAQDKVQTWSVTAGATPGLTRIQSMDNKPHRVVQTVELGTVATSSAGADVFFAQGITLAQLAQVASFTAVFDQYKIEQVEIWITPSYNFAAGMNPNSVYLTVIDYDDSTTPAAIGTLLQYSNCAEISATTGIYRRWRPHVGSMLAQPTSSVQGTANLIAPWIDSSTTGVIHNGFKMAVKASSVTSIYNARLRLTVAFRNVF